MAPPNKRRRIHIRVLAKAARFIEFFNQMETDPSYKENNALEECCKRMVHTFGELGETIIKASNCTR